MSYILDALNRADAERGLPRASASPHPTEPAMPHARHTGGRLWAASALAAALAVGSVAFYNWPVLSGALSGKSTRAPAAVQTPAEPLADPQDSPKDTAHTTMVLQAPEPQPGPPPAPKIEKAPVKPILAQAPPPPAPPPAPPRPIASIPKKAPAAVAPPTQVNAGPATGPLDPPPALTAAQRSALPPITISGTSYSNNPDLRLLIANGRVVKEGQTLSPGLTLEVIGPRSAVFNHQGTRFNVNY